MTEYLSVIDSKDQVIATASKEEVYARKLGHRIVHTFVFHPKTKQIFLQVRSKQKTYLPGYYCTSAAGHVQAGESYEEAGLRELKEELGVTGKLKHVITFPYDHLGMPIYIALFTCEHPGPFTFAEREVAGGEFLSMEAARKLINKGERIHPQLLACFEKL